MDGHRRVVLRAGRNHRRQWQHAIAGSPSHGADAGRHQIMPPARAPPGAPSTILSFGVVAPVGPAAARPVRAPRVADLEFPELEWVESTDDAKRADRLAAERPGRSHGRRPGPAREDAQDGIEQPPVLGVRAHDIGGAAHELAQCPQRDLPLYVGALVLEGVDDERGKLVEVGHDVVTAHEAQFP